MKRLKWVLLLLLLGIAVVVFLNYERLDILSGYSAKSMASSVFLAERDFEFTDSTDNNFSPVSIAGDAVNMEEKTASASVFGLKKRTAVYREGLGSVLIPLDYEYTPITIKPKRDKSQINLPYPYGNLQPKDTVLPNVDYESLQGVIDRYTADSLQTRAIVVLHKDQIIG